MEIIKAEKIHKDFILDANKKVNDVSGLKVTRLDEFIDSDLFCENPKFSCLVAIEDDKPVGMCIYSDMYMADHGMGYYLSNVFVVPEFRRQNIFNMFLQTINKNKDYKFMFAFVGNENAIMKDIMSKKGANELIGLRSYFLKIIK